MRTKPVIDSEKYLFPYKVYFNFVRKVQMNQTVQVSFLDTDQV